MENEIKFRYWDTSKNRYVTTDNMPTCGEDAEFFELSPWDDDSWEQYSGENDEEGKEIFEGDIVVCENRIKNKLYKIVKNKSVYKAIGINHESSTLLVILIEFNKLKIVGNIKENPELLTLENI